MRRILIILLVALLAVSAFASARRQSLKQSAGIAQRGQHASSAVAMVEAMASAGTKNGGDIMKNLEGIRSKASAELDLENTKFGEDLDHCREELTRLNGDVDKQSGALEKATDELSKYESIKKNSEHKIEALETELEDLEKEHKAVHAEKEAGHAERAAAHAQFISKQASLQDQIDAMSALGRSMSVTSDEYQEYQDVADDESILLEVKSKLTDPDHQSLIETMASSFRSGVVEDADPLQALSQRVVDDLVRSLEDLRTKESNDEALWEAASQALEEKLHTVEVVRMQRENSVTTIRADILAPAIQGIEQAGSDLETAQQALQSSQTAKILEETACSNKGRTYRAVLARLTDEVSAVDTLMTFVHERFGSEIPATGATIDDIYTVREESTWTKANDYCTSQKKRLCRRVEYCDMNGARTPSRGGIEGEGWAPTGDGYNQWLFVGSDNKTPQCALWTETHAKKPAFGEEDGEGARAHVLCCSEARPWTLVAFGEKGYVSHFLDENAGDIASPDRRGDATIDARPLLSTASEIAFAWNLEGFPNGTIDTYDFVAAVQINNPRDVSFRRKILPGDEAKPQSIQDVNFFSAVQVRCMKGECNLPHTMYTGAGSFLVEFGRAYGLVRNSEGDLEGDWAGGPQPYRALYLRVGESPLKEGVVIGEPGGEDNAVAPSTMAIFIR